MDVNLAVAVAAGAATLLGSVGVIGQIRVARRQLHLDETATYRELADAWREIREDWQRTLLAGRGPSRPPRLVPANEPQAFRDALENYRVARVRAQELMDSPGFSWENDPGSEIAAALGAEGETHHNLGAYVESVRVTLLFLGQRSSLMLRGRLSSDAIYDVLGADLLEYDDALTSVMRFSYDYGGCIAPMNEESRYMAQVGLDELSERFGWAESLGATPGMLDRIDLLRDTVAVMAQRVGEVDERWAPRRLTRVLDDDRLALRWQAARKFGCRKALRLSYSIAAAALEYRQGGGGWLPRTRRRLLALVLVIRAASTRELAWDPDRWVSRPEVEGVDGMAAKSDELAV